MELIDSIAFLSEASYDVTQYGARADYTGRRSERDTAYQLPALHEPAL